MSHASHQAHEQARREQRHAATRDKPEKSRAETPDKRNNNKSGEQAEPAIKGTAPAAPPRHEDEAFRVFDGSSPQSDG